MNIFVERPRRPHRRRFIMKARRRRRTSLPIMMTDLMFASWETVALRALLIAENKCSPAEYSRMLSEKAEAAAATGLALISSGGRLQRFRCWRHGTAAPSPMRDACGRSRPVSVSVVLACSDSALYQAVPRSLARMACSARFPRRGMPLNAPAINGPQGRRRRA
jgi:hypothetical protein